MKDNEVVAALRARVKAERPENIAAACKVSVTAVLAWAKKGVLPKNELVRDALVAYLSAPAGAVK